MKTLRLIGVPLDLGAGRRGVDMGPSALRLAQLGSRLGALGVGVEDGGNLSIPQREELQVGDPNLRYLDPIAQACRDVYAAVRRALDAGRVPVVLGGDHSLAAGSVAAAADDARRRGQRLGVLWLDAHGDMNTGTSSPSGNVHGMPTAALLGEGPDALCTIGTRPAIGPDQLALVGLRAIDPEEAAHVKASGVHAATMRDVDERGMRMVIREALASLGPIDRLHLSFDVDFLDAEIAPGVGTPVQGGPTFRESHLVMEMLADTGLVTSVDVVELNPIMDDRNKTALLVVGLLESLFGKRIL